MGDTQDNNGTGGDGGTGTGGDGGTTGTTDTTKTGDTGTQDGGNGTDSTGTTDAVSRADYDALMKRMQAADRRAQTEENARKALEDKDKSEAELAKQRAAEAEAKVVAMAQDRKNDKLLNAFLSDTTTSWHDSTDAFNLLRSSFMDGVEVDDDGNVTGLGPAIKKLAKDKAYLVKPAGTSEATGNAQNGTRKGADGKDKTDKEAMARRFPSAYHGAQF